MAFQEKEQKVEENTKASAARAGEKVQNNIVVGKGKEKAVGVADESSNSAKRKGKEAIYDRLVLRIFTYFVGIY